MEFPSYQQLYDEVVSELSDEGLDDASVIGSAANLIVNALLTRVSEIANRSRRASANSFPQNASGFYLDLHGEAHGLRRAGASPAFVLASDENLKITATSGTLVERLGTSIPSGTQVTTADGETVYNITQTAVPAGVTEMFLSAYCTVAGEQGNVNAGALNTLSIGASDVDITNVGPITTGRSAEIDSVYRNRIISYAQGSRNNSGGELVSLATGVQGVISARIIDTAFGISHPALMIAGTNRIRPGIIRRVEAIAQDVVPLGTRIRVIAPRYRDLELTLVIEVSPDANKTIVKNQVTQMVTNRYGVHIPGTALDLGALDQLLTRNVPGVRNATVEETIYNGQKFGAKVINTRATDQVILTSVRVEVL